MSGSHRLFKVLAVVSLAAFVSGCWTVRLSDTTEHEERVNVRIGGPGAREGELVRRVRLEVTHYSGERVSFGIMPGIPCMANDFGGAGYVPAGTLCLFVGPFVNAFTLAIPTLCTLAVEPFTMTSDSRGLKWDAVAMGFVGAYRWRVPSHDAVDSEKREIVLVDGGYRPDTAKIKVSRAKDGTKLWHAYPGFAALMGDVRANGKVDVLFSDGGEIRRFRKSEEDGNCLTYEDRPAGQ